MFEIADLANVTGAPTRSIIFWSDKGALRPERSTASGGKGVHRLFDRDELIVCAILAALHLTSAPIARLRSVAATMRGLLNEPKARLDVEAAIRDDYKVFLVVDQMPGATFYPGVPMPKGSKAWNGIEVITLPDGFRSYDGVRDYALNEMTRRNRVATIINVNGSLAGMRGYVPRGRLARASV